MKQWKCETCNNKVEVEDNYELKYCCRGGIHDSCGCGGHPINPIFCDECEEKIYGKRISDWPESLPMPTNEDIEDMAELSERNTGSDFFKKE